MGGERLGSCPGSDHLSVEESPETIKMRLQAAKAKIPHLKKTLRDLPHATTFSRVEEHYLENDWGSREKVPVRVTYNEGDPRFDSVKESILDSTERELGYLQRRVETAKREIENWEPTEMLTAQRVAAAERAEKEAKRGNLQQERYEKHFTKTRDMLHKLAGQLVKKEDALLKAMAKGDRSKISTAESQLETKISQILDNFQKLKKVQEYTDASLAEIAEDMELGELLGHMGVPLLQATDWRKKEVILREMGVYSDWQTQFSPVYPGFFTQVKKKKR
jgi:NADH dehydrogenase/NADH:ubiquinone oxidoreductase subunit G